MMTLISLPHELHLHIRSYLTTQDHAQIALTCKLCYQLYFPALSSLYTLPSKLHLQIRSYLSPENGTLVGLACKRLHSIYFPKPSIPLEEYSLWAMADYRAPGSLACQTPGSENPVYERWLFRVEIAHYLSEWVNRVTREARRRSGVPMLRRYPPIKFCAGCARFQRMSKGWRSGKECLSRIDRVDEWDDSEASGEDEFYTYRMTETERWSFWYMAERMIRDGGICGKCRPRWREFERTFLDDYVLYV